MDPETDFPTLFEAFDTVLLGRKTYEKTRQQGGGGGMPGMQAYVFSRTLRQSDCPKVTVTDQPVETVAALKATPGKDIWLFGGGISDIMRREDDDRYHRGRAGLSGHDGLR